jgi:hypothetical protein
MLLSAAALMTLNHGVLIVALDEPVLFIGYIAFTLYALLVIALPFRRLEPWAWYTTWLLPAGLAAPGPFAPDIAALYYAVAASCVVGLLLTMRPFFAESYPSEAAKRGIQ